MTNEEINYLKENKNLTVGVYIYYPPYEFINKNGEVDGILLEYLKILQENINYKFTPKFYTSFQKMLEDGKSGNVDIILEIQSTESRLKYFEFTKPIFRGHHAAYTLVDSDIKSLNQLKGKKITVVEHYSVQEYLEKNHPLITILPAANEKACLEKLLKKEVDAYIGAESGSNYFIRKEAYSNEIKLLDTINYDLEVGVAIVKSKPILCSIIKKGSQSISSDEKQTILNKWLYDITKPVYKKVSFWEKLFIIVSTVSLLFLILSYYLKKQIENRTQELNKAKIRAEKNDEIKTLLFQNISHEVRTPLNSIIAFSGFLNDVETKTEKKAYINTILEECYNLTNILNNVIDISELTTEKTPPKDNSINLDKELSLIADIYNIKARRKNLDFEFVNTIPKDKNFIRSDKTRLNKSITKLLDNAIKFTKEGKITLNSFIENDILKIAIIDTGIGIKSKKISNLFRSFYQEETELSKKYDGLGIGLSIAYINILSLKGQIKAKNNPDGKGATFTIELPVTYEVYENNTNIKSVNRQFKILIAEDMKLNYLVLEKILDKIITVDHEITWAKNGQEAVDLVHKNKFDVIFMDIKMPVLDGFQATKIIKKKYPKSIVIAQTAYAQEDDFNKASDIGFDAYLTKPIDLNVLKTTLKDFFQLTITEASQNSLP
ncbi:hypothetical protein MHTCC0001_33100 [Flavobacteriaceae bacterium MHTCC 0001]